MLQKFIKLFTYGLCTLCIFALLTQNVYKNETKQARNLHSQEVYIPVRGDRQYKQMRNMLGGNKSHKI